MIAAYLISLFFGFTIARCLLRERHLFVVLPVSLGVGLLSYLCFINAFMYVAPILAASWMALGLQLAMAAIIAWKAGRRFHLKWPSVPETLLAGAGVIAIVCYTLLVLFHVTDDDYWVHTPMITFFTQGVFPPMNPIFPDIQQHAHYGRNLLVGAISATGNLNVFHSIYLLTVILQAGSFIMACGLGAKFLRNGYAGIAMGFFVFLCARSGFGGEVPLSRYGLLEAMTNNNPVVYFSLLFLIYLLVLTFRRTRWNLTLLCTMLFGTYALVYETHYGTLLIVFSAIFAIDLIKNRRNRSRAALVHRTIVLVGSFLLGSVQGGSLTHFVQSKLRPAPAASTAEGKAAEALSGMSQQISVRFPKSPFLHVTTNAGVHLFLLGSDFLSRQGWVVWLMPLTLVICVRRRKPLGILLLAIGTVFLLIPSCIDFGRYNSESLRFIFGNGVAASLAFGVAWFALCETVYFAQGRWKWGVLGILLAVPLAIARPEISRVRKYMGMAWFHPEVYHIDTEDLLLANFHFLDPVDLEICKSVRPQIRQGDRVLTNLVEERTDYLDLQSTLAVYLGCPVVGYGISVPRSPWRMTARTYEDWPRRIAGYQKRAFWQTMDIEILRDLKVTILYVDRFWLTPAQEAALNSNPAFQRLAGIDKGLLSRREVYRVHFPARSASPRAASPKLKIESFSAPKQSAVGEFARARIVLRAQERWEGEITLVYRLSYTDTGIPVNMADLVRSRFVLKLEANQTAECELPFVAPLNHGSFVIEVGTMDSQGSFTALQTTRGERFVITTSAHH